MVGKNVFNLLPKNVINHVETEDVNISTYNNENYVHVLDNFIQIWLSY